ncbi:MAG: DUF3365 domain-containing protein [Bacteroidetes bacterium]|nr:DUF3365 domain-containing protein [Bacteroidota bacterium]
MKLSYAFFLLLSLPLLYTACGQNQSDEKAESEPRQTEAAAEDLSEEVWMKKGKEIAGATFATLSSNLQKAMQEGGVENAVKFCNLAAYPLTDSLAKVHNAQIRRTSLKPRNPQNAPSPEEKAVLTTYQEQEAAGKELKPLIEEIDPKTIAFYAPIRTNELCLNCHGNPGETLKKSDYAIINGLYPDDAAIGYQAGELRGMWSIQFKK